MGELHYLCEEGEWKKALDYIDRAAEIVSSLDNFGLWNSKVLDASDILYALSVLEDDIRDAMESEFYSHIDECDEYPYDVDELEEDDLLCDTCTEELCAYADCPCDCEYEDEDSEIEDGIDTGEWAC